jgi:hypothetical protein
MPDSSRAEQVINVPAKTIRNFAAGFWGESGISLKNGLHKPNMLLEKLTGAKKLKLDAYRSHKCCYPIPYPYKTHIIKIKSNAMIL